MSPAGVIISLLWLGLFCVISSNNNQSHHSKKYVETQGSVNLVSLGENKTHEDKCRVGERVLTWRNCNILRLKTGSWFLKLGPAEQ